MTSPHQIRQLSSNVGVRNKSDITRSTEEGYHTHTHTHSLLHKSNKQKGEDSRGQISVFTHLSLFNKSNFLNSKLKFLTSEINTII